MQPIPDIPSLSPTLTALPVTRLKSGMMEIEESYCTIGLRDTARHGIGRPSGSGAVMRAAAWKALAGVAARTVEAALPRGRHVVLVLLLLSMPLPADVEKQREFDLAATTTWGAALEVARGSFTVETLSKEHGTFRFRTIPRIGFRFEVSVHAAGPKKAKVILHLLNTNIPEVQKVAWRSGDKFFEKLAARLGNSK